MGYGLSETPKDTMGRSSGYRGMGFFIRIKSTNTLFSGAGPLALTLFMQQIGHLKWMDVAFGIWNRVHYICPVSVKRTWSMALCVNSVSKPLTSYV